ncbi:DeoR/GlpR family DNA-binding transcription regulator [Herbiconiux daphne]|uniref:DeoR/GlpR family DNA-binding transcription regulator n=1 Tax=Herbiconiux daphne TaxID=2970914 RepID=A0ABT2GX56_9MICO|nr:DeoR/GlpR family DNA-binding transcription regulator [Herbiconiux daphne]MCS5732517.1 DeoR/GlpR family DNA-binding transcription regulator [Herbiconiux daphne]
MTETDGRFAYASASERRDILAQYVIEQGYSTILELSQRFGVSEMTIRRDVARLVGEGRLRGFHGGVGSLSPVEVSGVDYGDRDQKMGEAKRAIAEHAVGLVGAGAVIAVDAGTTAAQFAALLPQDRRLQVITHSLPAINILSNNQGVEITGLGGVLHQESLSFSGPATLAALANLHIDTLFLAASGLNERGAYCGNSFDAITKRALIDVSDTVVLLADSSKFETSAMVRTCEWDAIDRLIVDSGLRPEDERMLAQFDIAIEKVGATAASGSPELAGSKP